MFAVWGFMFPHEILGERTQNHIHVFLILFLVKDCSFDHQQTYTF